MDELNEIDSSFSTLNENKLIDLILYGSNKFDDKKNQKNHNILMSTIKFIKDSQRSDENLFSRVLLYVFRFNFSFCVNNGLEKKKKIQNIQHIQIHPIYSL